MFTLVKTVLIVAILDAVFVSGCASCGYSYGAHGDQKAPTLFALGDWHRVFRFALVSGGG